MEPRTSSTRSPIRLTFLVVVLGSCYTFLTTLDDVPPINAVILTGPESSNDTDVAQSAASYEVRDVPSLQLAHKECKHAVVSAYD